MRIFYSFLVATVLIFYVANQGTTGIVRSGEKVIIEGVELAQTREGRDCSFIGSIAALMSAVGEKGITYEWLMGVSGAAFRIQRLDWSTEALSPFKGFNYGAIAIKSIPYDIIRFTTSGNEQKAIEAVTASINKGVPVIGVGEETGLIVGYTGNGKTFLWKKYSEANKTYSESAKLPGEVLILGEKRGKTITAKLVVDSLELAIALGSKNKIGNYDSGINALNIWAAQLEDESSFSLLGNRGRKTRAEINALQYASLINSRKAASVYLKNIAGTFRRESRSELIRASEAYDAIYKKLKNGASFLPYPYEQAGTMAEKWTPEMRKKQAKLLKDIASDEKYALRIISSALQAARTAMD